MSDRIEAARRRMADAGAKLSKGIKTVPSGKGLEAEYGKAYLVLMHAGEVPHLRAKYRP